MEVSASEAEERGFSTGAVSLDRVTKEQLYAAYRRTQERYTKYRTQYADLARHYKLLERENAKARVCRQSILLPIFHYFNKLMLSICAASIWCVMLLRFNYLKTFKNFIYKKFKAIFFNIKNVLQIIKPYFYVTCYVNGSTV